MMRFRPVGSAGNVKRFGKYWTGPRVVIGCDETCPDGSCRMKVRQRLEPFAARLRGTQHLGRKTRITTNNPYSSRNRIRFPTFPNQSQKMRIRPLHNAVEISPRLMPRCEIWRVLKNDRMNQRTLKKALLCSARFPGSPARSHSHLPDVCDRYRYRPMLSTPSCKDCASSKWSSVTCDSPTSAPTPDEPSSPAPDAPASRSAIVNATRHSRSTPR